MKHRLAAAFALVLTACLACVPAGSSAVRASQLPGSSSVRTTNASGSTIHVRMEAIITANDDGSNPKGILSAAQLRTWIHSANLSFRVSNANIVLDFDPAKDLAHVRNTKINHLAHNNDAVASAQAAHYPGKMVVFFRAYGPAGSGIGVTGNGYTAYNRYVPIGSVDCNGRVTTGCSASYTVMPSVYCGTQVATDLVDQKSPAPPLVSDGSGCKIPASSWYVYQNFNQLTHEVGHYFGLPHTFPGSYDFLSTPSALQSWYDGPPRSGTNRSIHIYDGDSASGPVIFDGTNLMSGWVFTVPDTSADAGAHLFTGNNMSMCHTPVGKTLTDKSGATIVFNGSRYTLHASFSGKPVILTFRPDKGDVMSYFLCKRPMTFSPGQVATMRNNLLKDPQRSYLVCNNPQDADLRAYADCPATIPHVMLHPRTGPTPKAGTPITVF